MPVKKDKNIVVIGETNFRNQKWRFGIKEDDRRRHMYVVGSTGMGKSEFLKNMAIQDIESGRGLAFIDPHGDSADDLLDYVPKERIEDVIYLDPGDLAFPIAFNVMEKVGFEYRHLVASGLLGVFKKIFGVEVWSGRMEYILNNTILALLEYPDATLLSINRMLSDKEYRNKVVDNVNDPIVKSFWTNEFAKYTDRYMQEATPAIQNKIGQFISNNLIRNIIGQVHSTIDIRKVMDEGKILIVNISRGKIGEDASRLLGALLVTKIQLAAMSRVDILEKDRRDFYLYVDEFQHFATESFANILSEARKYHLSLIMAHQYIKQMEEEVVDAVFGNVGTIISFRVGAEDGEFLEKWFQPDFLMNDIVNLGKYNIYLKLMIDGVSSRGFSATTIPPLPKLEKSNREDVINFSRNKYATARETVEKNIAEWALNMDKSAENQGRQPKPNEYHGPMSERKQYQQIPRPNSQLMRPSVERGSTEASRSNVRPSVERVSTEAGNRRNMQMPRQEFTKPRIENPQLRQNYEVSRPQPQARPVTSEPKREERVFSRPLSDTMTLRPQIQPQRPVQPQPSPSSGGLSLNEALRSNPVNFKGKRMDDKKREKPKVEVNTDALKKALEEAMKGGE